MISAVSVVSPNGVPQIGPVKHFSPNFKAQAIDNYGPKEVRDFPDRTEYVYETEGSSGKKWGVGIASAFIDGLGQAINGEWGKGALFFLGAVATHLGSWLLPATGKFGAGALCGLAALGIKIWAVVDAVKSAKSKETVIVPKTPLQAQGHVAQAPQGINYQA